MNRFRIITCGFSSALLLFSCSEILEPVSLFEDKQKLVSVSEQEEFQINIKSLTFDETNKANNTFYPRQLILTGSGSSANVVDEAIFLKSSFPKSSSSPNYLLGIGDEISFVQLNKFETD